MVKTYFNILRSNKLLLNIFESSATHEKTFFEILSGEAKTEKVRDLLKEKKEKGWNLSIYKDDVVEIEPMTDNVVIKYIKIDEDGNVSNEEIYVYKEGFWFQF